jgi:hypothetical protein
MMSVVVVAAAIVVAPASAQHANARKPARKVVVPKPAPLPTCVMPAAGTSTGVGSLTGDATPLTAAALRADPVGSKGKTVRWTVRVFALETADPLRKGLAPDEPYLLASGPGSENAVLYVAVPPALLDAARSTASAAPMLVTIVATVRTGRSDPVGVPILDAMSLARQ